MRAALERRVLRLERDQERRYEPGNMSVREMARRILYIFTRAEAGDRSFLGAAKRIAKIFLEDLERKGDRDNAS